MIANVPKLKLFFVLFLALAFVGLFGGSQARAQNGKEGNCDNCESGEKVPEPTTLALLGLGAAGLGLRLRKRT
jgi:hypothetical protein